MKENLADIMNELKVGQILTSKDGKEWIFIEAKKTRAVLRNRKTGKEYLFSGPVEVSQEIDRATVEALEEEAIQEYLKSRAVKKMSKGQHFIGNDDKEYVFLKHARTTFSFIDPLTKEVFKGKPMFVKAILEKTTLVFTNENF